MYLFSVFIPDQIHFWHVLNSLKANTLLQNPAGNLAERWGHHHSKPESSLTEQSR